MTLNPSSTSLLWMCARCSWDKDLAKRDAACRTAYGNWELGALQDISDAKRLHHERQWTQRRLRWISDGVEPVKSLCVEIRKLLFPLGKNEECLLELLRTPREALQPLHSSFWQGYRGGIKEWYGSVCQSPNQACNAAIDHWAKRLQDDCVPRRHPDTSIYKGHRRLVRP